MSDEELNALAERLQACSPLTVPLAQAGAFAIRQLMRERDEAKEKAAHQSWVVRMLGR